jgi:hypothetical protein
MHTENSFVNNRTNGEIVEHGAKCAPERQVVPPFNFVIEAIDLGYLGTFVISAQQKNVLRVLNLVGKQQTHHLDAILSSVDKVSNHEIFVRRWSSTTNFEKF